MYVSNLVSQCLCLQKLEKRVFYCLDMENEPFERPAVDPSNLAGPVPYAELSPGVDAEGPDTEHLLGLIDTLQQLARLAVDRAILQMRPAMQRERALKVFSPFYVGVGIFIEGANLLGENNSQGTIIAGSFGGAGIACGLGYLAQRRRNRPIRAEIAALNQRMDNTASEFATEE